jgi:hypothetical protein
MRRLHSAALLAFFGCLSCGNPPVEPKPPITTTQSQPATNQSWMRPARAGFDDRSYDSLPVADAFFQLSAKGSGETREVKFIIEDFNRNPSVHYLDSIFYKMHDEWYWFRLLNDQPVREQKPRAMKGDKLPTIEAVYKWAAEQKQLPAELNWVEDNRLYAPHFYEVATSFPRDFGLGTILYLPAKGGKPARWAFELEYNDRISHEELVKFFAQMEPTLPKEIFSQLRWLIRSPYQEEIAKEMESAKLKYHDRVMRYEDIVVAGEVEVYGAGLTAGHLRHVKDVTKVETYATDILILDDIPDSLPPASGLITAVPQTPLAHIALLARNRGIPNAYRGGLMDDPKFNQMASGHAAVIVRTIPPNQLDIVQISEEELRTWYEMTFLAYPDPPKVPYDTAPNTIVLSELKLSDVDNMRPFFGGKNAGFLALREANVTMPENAIGISIKPYWEHMDPLLPSIRQMMISADFSEGIKGKFLALEGPKRYEKRFPGPEDKKFMEAIWAKYEEGTPLGQLYRKGLINMIEDAPIKEETLADIKKTLDAQFGVYHAEQGIRFRSSSTIEDIEGFNGAGLYESFTGYLQPEKVSEKKKKQDISWAIKHTWASYWCFEAFQERETAGVNHLSGGMALLAHANFPDKKELSNGVFTVTIYPEGFQEHASMELNVQKGALSVTNPEAKDNALPEVNRVGLLRGESTSSITRKKQSTLAETGKYLLTDEQLREIFTQGVAVTEAVIAQQNSKLSKERHTRTLTLDFEFRQMDAGWPTADKPARIVIKQARSLEPGMGKLPALIKEMSAPKDVIARANKVVRRVFQGEDLNINVTQLYTDPLKFPDVGFSQIPFTAEIEIETIQQIPALDAKRAVIFRLPHTAWTGASFPDGLSDDKWSIAVTLTEEEAKRLGVSSLEVSSDGTCRITKGEMKYEGKAKEMKTDLIYATPDAYLLELLSAKKK